MADGSQIAAEYRRRLPGYQRAAESVQSLISSLLEDDGVNHLSVTARAKDEESFAKKAEKPGPNGALKYADPMQEITDMIGVRVITYLLADVERVLELVKDHFDVREESDKGALTAARGEYGYSSHHLLVVLSGARADQAEYASLRDQVVEIQVRTTLQHAWAEFEHDIRYKAALTGSPNAEVNRRFLPAAGLLELADNEFARIDDLTRVAVAPEEQPSPDDVTPMAGDILISGPALAEYLTERYRGAARSKQEHYEWMAELISRAGIDSIAALDCRLQPPSPAVVGSQHSSVRRIDDELLSTLGVEWLAANQDTGDRRRRRLQSRLDRMGKGLPADDQINLFPGSGT